MADAHIDPVLGASQRRAAKPQPVKPDWLAKTLAGTVLGLSLSLIVSGILAALLRAMPLPVSSQLAMWLVPPVWLLVQSLVYLFATGLRAWLWLGGINALALGIWCLLKAGSLT